VTALGQALIVISALAGAIIYGTDVFCTIVMRPALTLVDVCKRQLGKQWRCL